MTDQEKKLLDMTADLWNEFLKLPKYHSHDGPEFMIHIHALQNMIVARKGFRELANHLPPNT